MFLLTWSMSATAFGGHFEEAVKAYGQKDWRKAQNLFEQHLINNKEDAHAYFNMGTCFFQQEKYVAAIWNFEKAYKLDPALTDLPLLLDKSYQKAGLSGNWEPPVSYFKLKLFQFPEMTWALVLLGLSLLTGILLFAYFGSGRKKLVLGLVIFSAVIWAFCCYAFNERGYFASTVTHAIVMENTDAVYVSNEGNALQEIKLKAGERLEVVEVKDRVAVSFGHGEEFWMPRKKLRLIE